MEILVIVFTLVLLVSVAIIVCAVCLVRKTEFKNDVHISGGADAKTGQMIIDKNYFKGVSGETIDTVVIGSDFSKIDNRNKGITVEINNLSVSKAEVITITDYLIIGRAEQPQCYCLAHDRAVSGKHCKLYVSDGELYIEDLGSSNHTYVNKRVIRQPRVCRSGDLIKIGNTLLKIEIK